MKRLMREVHGVADLPMKKKEEPADCLVRDHDDGVELAIRENGYSAPTYVRLTPEEARFIAACLTGSAQRATDRLAAPPAIADDDERSTKK